MRHCLQPLLAAPKVPHRLVNAARGVVLATRIDTAFESARRREGLLRHTALREGDALVIAPCQAVHSFGMAFPIDVLFVNRAGKVLKVVRGLRPSRIALCVRAFAAIECAARHPGVAATMTGDVLAVHPQQVEIAVLEYGREEPLGGGVVSRSSVRTSAEQ